MKIECGLVESLETWVFRGPCLNWSRDRFCCHPFATCFFTKRVLYPTRFLLKKFCRHLPTDKYFKKNNSEVA